MKLFNICIRNGPLPSVWKCTNVVYPYKMEGHGSN